uniref:Amino acid permease/ SLC12A domain-containing protein n=1 Tax=Acrobeloides nanus TaxID=290746 RepID=A0A914E3E0_9BILA
MDNRPRRFSTIKQLNPATFKVIDKIQGRLGAISDDVEDGEEQPKPYRKQSLTNKIFSSTVNNLALFKDDDDELVSVHGGGTGAAIIGGYTVPGPKERASSERKKANLGVMLGVFLPTIQHILGVTMFIRLFWVVGVAGVGHSMVLLLCCCSCTFLTSISLSAVSTNGVIESGGAYFMISRNLGAEFGSAVGILFYLANTVATSMYLVGGVEVLLLYIFPGLTLFGGEEVHSDTGMFGLMSHNYRIYGTALLFIQLVIVAVGVRFVQLLAPVSLLCVILSLLACFGGGVEKALAQNGQHVCMLNEQLLPSKIYMPHNVSDITRICEFCNKSDRVSRHFCTDDKKDESACIQYTKSLMKCENAFPGYNSKTLLDNFSPQYMLKGESKPGYKADGEREVGQDATTTFFILMAIYFPAVTGIMTGTNMSGTFLIVVVLTPCNNQ